MSKADEMLEDIGFIKYSENEDTLIYKHEGETFEVSLTFDKRPFKKTFFAVDMLWIPKNGETWSTQKFENKWDKYCSSQGHWTSMWHEFSTKELQAICEKVKELCWNEQN